MDVYRVKTGSILPLGKQGENLVRQIQFDLSRWISNFGPGTVQLLHQRSGDEAPYPVAMEQEGNLAVWTVTSADTAAAGTGRAELQYYVGDALAKSETWMTKVLPALGPASETPPEAQQGWVDQVLAQVARITGMTAQAVELPAGSAPTADYADGVLTIGIPLGGDVSEAQIAQAVAEYLSKNPITETDPTVPDWAKEETKPSYTAAEVGADPSGTAAAQGVALKAMIDAITIPTALPNPNALTFTGAVTGRYDGSAPLEVEIPSGGGGTGEGDDVFELIGEATSSGVSDIVGLTIPFDGSLYKTIIAYAYNLPAGNNKRIIIRKKKEWYDGSPLGWNTVLDTYLASLTKMNNTWGFFGAAIDVGGKLFTLGAAEAKANAGHGYFRFWPQDGVLPTLSLSDCKFISLDCNSNSEILPDGCSLIVWGVRK